MSEVENAFGPMVEKIRKECLEPSFFATLMIAALISTTSLEADLVGQCQNLKDT